MFTMFILLKFHLGSFGFLFNGISNIVRYLMPKTSLLKNSTGTTQLATGKIKDLFKLEDCSESERQNLP